MNHKWVRILLGALVLGTWGAVVRRAVHRPGPEAAVAEQATPARSPSATTDAKEPLPVLPRDPFLEQELPHAPVQMDGAARATTVPSVRKDNNVTKPPTTWPEIRYNGIVRTPGEAGSGVAFLSVGGRNVLLRRGHASEGVQVLDLAMDSVVVVWNSEKRTIHRR